MIPRKWPGREGVEMTKSTFVGLFSHVTEEDFSIRKAQAGRILQYPVVQTPECIIPLQNEAPPGIGICM